MKFVSTLSLMPLLFLSSIFSALSTCLTLGPETWRPSPWSRCSSIPHTTPESRGTSATPRPPPFGTMMPWRQTGTGSTPAKRPSRVASGPWRKTAWQETRRLLRPERRVMNCDTETRRERLVFRKNTQWMPCVHTLKRQYKQTLCACIAQVSKRIKAVLSCQPCLLPEEAQRKRMGWRNWDEGQQAFDKSFIYFPLASSQHVETVGPEKNPSDTWKTTSIICRVLKKNHNWNLYFI